MFLLRAFIKVLDCVPAATGQVAVHGALGSAETAGGEGGYTRMRPGGACAGEGCPDAWSSLLLFFNLHLRVYILI